MNEQGWTRLKASQLHFEVVMKHRLERVNEVIRRELSEIISREINFSAQTLVTVHAVDVTPDLRQCHVFVSVIGKTDQKARVLAELDRTSRHASAGAREKGCTEIYAASQF